jgi:hypothetical protein
MRIASPSATRSTVAVDLEPPASFDDQISSLRAW